MSASSPPFLRVSDFCRPHSFVSSLSNSPPHQPHPPFPRRQQRPCLRVTPQMTTTTRMMNAPQSFTPTSTTCCAVGWVDVEVLLALSQKEGEYARLSLWMDSTPGTTTSATASTTTNKRRRRSIMLRLYLNQHESSTIQDLSGGAPEREYAEGDNAEREPSLSMRSGTPTSITTTTTRRVIHLPPITWMNLMGRRQHPTHDEIIQDSLVCLLESMIDTYPLPAATILLRPFARPPEWPRLPGILLPTTNTNATDMPPPPSSSSSLLTPGTHDDAFVWKYPGRHTLIQKSQLLSVYEKKSTDPKRGRHQSDRTVASSASSSSCCYFYQVLDVTATKEESSSVNRHDCDPNDDDNNNNNNDPHDLYYIITNSTVFQLDHRPLFSNNNDCNNPHPTTTVPRLPCFLAQKHYYDSLATLPSSSSSDHPQHHLHSKEFKVPPHPDLPTLYAALDLVGVSSPPHERILHVVGTDHDHDVSWAVETASNHIGRTCWSLKGLAAVAHAMGHTVRTGSLVDQLVGLQAALKEIQQKRMEPCVLHLVNIDEELSSTNDDGIRHEQEHRFWYTIVQALVTHTRAFDDDSASSMATTWASTTTSDDFSRHGSSTSSHSTCCPLIVVLSSSKPLKPGPWLENLVFPSIQLSLPTVEYTKYLWNVNNDIPWDDAMAKLLHGRGSRDIRKLRDTVVQQQQEQQQNHGNNPEEALAMLQTLCRTYDDQRRTQQSAAVAQVRWEDVGGLAHVRSEIMDAIELPLKFPHLFSGGKGRSGILLYGPPGTGKTLVAKAVATECGLPFMSVKGPELLGSYVGESESNVREVFQSAREAAERNAPVLASILFFDELDSLAPKRGGVGDGGGVMERVVATLLAELDQNGGHHHDKKGRVFVLGATNRPDLLDPSLLRPGRLDRCVYLGIPSDDDERARILAAQLHRLKLDEDADPMDMARAVVTQLPPRLTGADFSTIASGALLLAVERLCRQADDELLLMMKLSLPSSTSQGEGGGNLELHDVLQEWGEEKCTPTIGLNDLYRAAETVVPSVSEEELSHYERLREQYSTHTVPESPPMEHDGDLFYQAEVQ